jgi:FkbM family methyltransferase
MPLLHTLHFILRHPLNRRRKAGALLGFVRWQLACRLKPGPRQVEWVNGARLMIHPGESTLTGNLYCGLYEFAEMAYLLHVLRPSDLFVDVGANLGSYTLLAGASVGARVIAFEPEPQVHARLQENIRLNRIESRVRALNLALGEAEAELAFRRHLTSGHHIVEPQNAAASDLRVKVLPLDAALSGESPNLLKVDVEGYETAVLRGASQALADPSLHSVILELKGRGDRYGFDENELVTRLRGAGFAPYAYHPFTRALQGLQGRDPASGNTLFVRGLAHVESRLASAPRFRVHGAVL